VVKKYTDLHNVNSN